MTEKEKLFFQLYGYMMAMAKVAVASRGKKWLTIKNKNKGKEGGHQLREAAQVVGALMLDLGLNHSSVTYLIGKT